MRTAAVRQAVKRSPEENRRLIQRFDDAPAYERIFRDDRSDRHILTGERHGKGGHRARTGFPGKTEFPDAWSDQRILDAVDTAAQNPVEKWGRKDFFNGNTNFNYVGHADGLRITVVVDRDARVVSAFPEKGQGGVYRNPRKPKSPPGVNRPVWTRGDGAGGDGYWTWKGPGGEPLHTDRRGRPLDPGDGGQPVPPPLRSVPFVPVPPGGGED